MHFVVEVLDLSEIYQDGKERYVAVASSTMQVAVHNINIMIQACLAS